MVGHVFHNVATDTEFVELFEIMEKSLHEVVIELGDKNDMEIISLVSRTVHSGLQEQIRKCLQLYGIYL
jgi:hypothetical protein